MGGRREPISARLSGGLPGQDIHDLPAYVLSNLELENAYHGWNAEVVVRCVYVCVCWEGTGGVALTTLVVPSACARGYPHDSRVCRSQYDCIVDLATKLVTDRTLMPSSLWRDPFVESSLESGQGITELRDSSRPHFRIFPGFFRANGTRVDTFFHSWCRYQRENVPRWIVFNDRPPTI